MRTIRLNGELGKRFGRIHRLDVRTPAEAMRAIQANNPEFTTWLIDSAERGVSYRIVADRDDLLPALFDAPFSRNISVTPVVSGGAFIGAGFVALFTAITAATGSAVLGMLLMGVALKGISSLLSPSPNKSNSATKEENPYFSGPENVTAQGVSVPIGYGRAIVGSVTISAAITVEQPAPANYGIGGYPIGVVF